MATRISKGKGLIGMPEDMAEVMATHARVASERKHTVAIRDWVAGRSHITLPLIAGVLFLVCWQMEVFHRIFGLAVYQLPLPSNIWQAMVQNRVLLLQSTLYTGTEIVGGFFAGSLLGWLVAVGSTFFPRFSVGGMWVVASLNAVPIVALAPIMDNWLGDGISSRIGVVAVITMATMAVNAYKGMTSIERSYFELMHSYGTNRRQLFWKLRVRHSLPHVFAALKINMSTSIIGSLVGEAFISVEGLGYVLSNQVQLANMPIAWACIVIASGFGIVSYYLIASIEKLVLSKPQRG